MMTEKLFIILVCIVTTAILLAGAFWLIALGFFLIDSYGFWGGVIACAIYAVVVGIGVGIGVISDEMGS